MNDLMKTQEQYSHEFTLNTVDFRYLDAVHPCMKDWRVDKTTLKTEAVPDGVHTTQVEEQNTYLCLDSHNVTIFQLYDDGL